MYRDFGQTYPKELSLKNVLSQVPVTLTQEPKISIFTTASLKYPNLTSLLGNASK